MPGLTPTRTEISDRFSVLGFRVRSGRNPYFEVAIATDPSLFHADAKSQRSAANFFSSHSSGPILAEHGEAMYFIPPHALRHFAGKERLYYTVAAFPDTSRVNPELLDVPDQARPWITISKSFTGREIRRLIGAPSRHATSTDGNGYRKISPDAFQWAGDDVMPGASQRVEPVGRGITAPGKGASSSQPTSASPNPGPTNGSKFTATAPASTASALAREQEFEYDDGHGQEFWAQQQEETSEPDFSQYGIDGPIPDGPETAESQSLAQALDIAPEYPQADRFAPAANFYASPKPRSIDTIVIHITDGHPDIEGTISWFQTPEQKIKGKRVYASSHYVVGQQGQVVQMVRNQDVAYHASEANAHSIGIEHAARSPHEWGKNDPGFDVTDAEYCASAALVRWLCNEFNLPMDRDHIKGHVEVDPKKRHPDCPIGVWNWDYYMSLVTSGTCTPRPTSSESQSYSFESPVHGKVRMSATPKKATTHALEVVQPDYVPSDKQAALQTQLDFQTRYKQWFAGVADTSFFPHSAICQLVRDDGGFGTGTYIAPDRILTAAHVVEGANSITVIPGKNGGTANDGPFGHFTCPSSDWEKHPNRKVGNDDFDLAVLRVGTPPPGGQFFDILEELRQSLPSNIIVCGYSAQSDKYPKLKDAIDPNKQHLDGDYIRTVQDETFRYNLQTLHGASGAAVYYVWAREDDVRQQSVLETHLVGVHVAPFSDTLNEGCRLTDAKIAWIQSVGQPISAGASVQGYSLQQNSPKASAPASRSYAVAGNPAATIAKPLARSAAAGAAQSTGSFPHQPTGVHKRTQTRPGVSAQAQDVGAEVGTAASASLKDTDYTVEVGDSPDPEREASATPAAIPLTNQAMYEVIRQVAAGHSGDGLYSAISTDREFATPGHGAFQKRHFGLGFGLLLFTQESGQLGAALQLMHDRDPERFSKIFGADSDALLAVTNAATPEARLQPVSGENLWSPTWVSRFQEAGAYPLYQAAQNELAIEGLFRPLLHVAGGFGLVTDRLLAMALDIAVCRGVGGAIRWLAHHVGPFETSAQRYHAIEALGVDNLANFQAEVGWTPQDGRFGPETHAALAGALRRLDIMPMAKSSDLACRLVATAEGALKQRLLRLRDSPSFTDQVYELN
jgi:V8-like Glu-specific endopeptidase/N-acetyl-anhydromuramyl-L-alanine amidase AmpD